MNIYDVLHKIQQKLRAPKNQYNKFGGFHYRSCEDILEAVKPLLPASCVLTIRDEIISVGDRVYVKAIADLRQEGEVIHSTAFAREQETKKGMDASQITGATSSYARKYALNGLFLIDDCKDADANGKREDPPKQTEIPTESQKPHFPVLQNEDKPKWEMSSKQWKKILAMGAEKQLSQDEVIELVKWKAEELGVEPRHWKVAKAMIEGFDRALDAYLDWRNAEDTPY